MLRTESTAETADLIVHIAEQQKKRLARFLEREGYSPPVVEGLRSVNTFAMLPGVVDMKGGVQTNRECKDLDDLPAVVKHLTRKKCGLPSGSLSPGRFPIIDHANRDLKPRPGPQTLSLDRAIALVD